MASGAVLPGRFVSEVRFEGTIREYRKEVENIIYNFDYDEASHQGGQSAWPPWPWPPWGGKPAPEDRARRARRLSKLVLQLDLRLASAHTK